MKQFKIEGMHCMSCFRNIEDVLKQEDEKCQVSVDMDKEVISVDSKLSDDKIKKLVDELGYKATAMAQ